MVKRLMMSTNMKKKDVCPKCSTHFRKDKVKILWKDVVECTYCGNIWVLRDFNEFNRWY